MSTPSVSPWSERGPSQIKAVMEKERRGREREGEIPGVMAFLLSNTLWELKQYGKGTGLVVLGTCVQRRLPCTVEMPRLAWNKRRFLPRPRAAALPSLQVGMRLSSSKSSCESTQRGRLWTKAVALKLVEMLFTRAWAGKGMAKRRGRGRVAGGWEGKGPIGAVPGGVQKERAAWACCLDCGTWSSASSPVLLHSLCVSLAPLRDMHSPGLSSAQHAHRTWAIEGFVFCTCS